LAVTVTVGPEPLAVELGVDPEPLAVPLGADSEPLAVSLGVGPELEVEPVSWTGKFHAARLNLEKAQLLIKRSP
jgi:hypothetical protein